MEKYLATIEFRYSDAPVGGDDFNRCIARQITLGVFDTRDDANDCGNKCLEILESKFKLNPNYKKRERFSNTGGCFGYPNDLITDLAYLVTPFSFFAKITVLKYGDVEEEIQKALDAVKRVSEHDKNSQL